MSLWVTMYNTKGLNTCEIPSNEEEDEIINVNSNETW